MLGSTLLRSPASSSGVLLRGHRSDQKRPIVVRCERNYPPFPKVLRPLGRPTLLDTFVDMLPLVEKTKYKLTGLYFLDSFPLLVPEREMFLLSFLFVVLVWYMEVN